MPSAKNSAYTWVSVNIKKTQRGKYVFIYQVVDFMKCHGYSPQPFRKIRKHLGDLDNLRTYCFATAASDAGGRLFVVGQL